MAAASRSVLTIVTVQMHFIFAFPLLLVILAGCAAPTGTTTSASGPGRAGITVRLIGSTVIPNDLRVGDQPVGGLSGMDRAADGSYLLLSDDRSARGPARFFRAEIAIDQRGVGAISWKGSVTIRQPDGTAHPAAGKAPGVVVDPESIRFDATTGTWYWSSEGDGVRGIDPFIREMRGDGSFVRELPLHPMFRMSGGDSGPRDNGVFEGIALTDAGQMLIALEEPLLQDGPAATPTDVGPVRLSVIDKTDGRLLRQIAYIPETAPAPRPDTGVTGNGISEILTLDSGRLLVLERGFAIGAGVTARLFVVDLRSGTDVSAIWSLAEAAFTPVDKRLVVDFGTLGLPVLDNLEALCWGPTLPSGERTLLVVSDNNFNPAQVTQLIVLALEMPE